MENCHYKVISLFGGTEEIFETDIITYAVEKALSNNTKRGAPVQLINIENDEVLLVGNYTEESSWISREIAPYVICYYLLN